MTASGEWTEGKGDRAHLSSLFRAEALGHQIQETRQTGSRTPWRASEEGSPDHFRRNPSFSSSSYPGSQPLFLSLAKERVELGDLECRAQAGVWQPQETHLPAVSQHLAWMPGANQAALGTARGILTDALVWSQPGWASC